MTHFQEEFLFNLDVIINYGRRGLSFCCSLTQVQTCDLLQSSSSFVTDFVVQLVPLCSKWLRFASIVLGFFMNGAELSLYSVNSGNLGNHRTMNWVQFMDLLCYPYLCVTVVSSLPLTNKVVCSNIDILLIFNFLSLKIPPKKFQKKYGYLTYIWGGSYVHKIPNRK